MCHRLTALKTCLYYIALLALGWSSAATTVSLAWESWHGPSMASTAAAISYASEWQRLESLDGLSDEEIRHIYLYQPWRLPDKLTLADQQKLDRVMRNLHPVERPSTKLQAPLLTLVPPGGNP